MPASTAEILEDELSTNGWSEVNNPLLETETDVLVEGFEALLEELGSDDLARLTSANVTGRRGGDYGYVRRVDMIESKDAFRLRLRLPPIDRTKAPADLLEFMELGREAVHESEVAFRAIFGLLEPRNPGIYDMHFNDPSQADTSIRIVLSDDKDDPAEVIAEPHHDISSLTMHERTNRLGTFYVVQPDGEVVFPDTGGDVSALFVGGGMNSSNELGELMPSVLHGAVNGIASDGKRRGIVVAQIQPNLTVATTPPPYEQTHVPSEELPALLDKISASYRKLQVKE